VKTAKRKLFKQSRFKAFILSASQTSSPVFGVKYTLALEGSREEYLTITIHKKRVDNRDAERERGRAERETDRQKKRSTEIEARERGERERERD
jgi:hypothetical protein